MGKHLKALTKAAASALSAQQQYQQQAATKGRVSPEEEEEEEKEKPSPSALSTTTTTTMAARKRGGDLVDGLALLIFHITSGVRSQGRLHSKAEPVLRVLFQQEAKGRIDDDHPDLNHKGTMGGLGQVQRMVLEGALTYLCEHVKPAHAGLLWKEALQALAVAPREETGQANGLERCLHILVVLLRYRLVHEEEEKKDFPSSSSSRVSLRNPLELT